MLAVLLEVGIDADNIQANFCFPRLQKKLSVLFCKYYASTLRIKLSQFDSQQLKYSFILVLNHILLISHIAH